MYPRSDPSPYKWGRVAIVGIGGLGCHLVAGLNHRRPRARIVTINTDKRGGIKTGEATSIQLGELGVGTGSQPAVASALAARHLPEIKEALADVELVILVAGLGKGTGSGATPVVAQCVRALGAQPLVLAAMPEDTASPRIVRQASATLAELQRNSISVLTLQQGGAPHCEDSSVHHDYRFSGLQQIRDWCHDLATLFLSIMDERVLDFFGWDAEDFKYFLELPGTCAWASGTAHGPSRVQESTINALLALNSASSKLAAAHGLVHMISAKRPPRLSELTSILAQTFHRSNSPDPFRILYVIEDDTMRDDEFRVTLLSKAMPRRLRIVRVQ